MLRFGKHIRMQPAIKISDDGTGAKIRIRMLHQMSAGFRASLGETPMIYDVPFHYANPVKGRTELAPASKK